MQHFYKGIACALLLCLCACKKQLEQSVSDSISGIDSLIDCERLLNDYALFGEQPISPELSADNYYVRETSWSKLSGREKNIYCWATDLLEGGSLRDYDMPYKQIYHTNEILKALPSIAVDSAQGQRRLLVEGSAYFFRSLAHYNLLQLFARPYNAPTATTDTGIVLRLTPDVTEFRRATMQQSYQRVIDDLLTAASLLPGLPSISNRHIPSKTAAWALLSRVYLSMRDYEEASLYADTCLRQYNLLLNYNEWNIAQPLVENQPEVIFQAYLNGNTKMITGRLGPNVLVDSTLYQSYRSNDLRQKMLYKLIDGKPQLNYSYSGNALCFGGLSTSEVYLTLAECRVRQGRYTEALATLNALLICRYKPGSGQQVQLDSFDHLLDTIFTERRKELAFRGLRWTDLRRLNKEHPGPPIIRLIEGRYYELPANDLRYTFPIPDAVISETSIVQNPR